MAVCLNITSDFDMFHSAWKTSVGEGWSSASTVSTFLVILQSVLAELPANVDEEGCAELAKEAAAWIEAHPDRVLDVESPDASELAEEAAAPAEDAGDVDPNITCYVEGVGYTDDVLGVLLRWNNKRLVTPCELLSATAWKRGERQSATKEAYTHYLPAWVNARHAGAERWRALQEAGLRGLARAKKGSPMMENAFEVYPQALHGLVCELLDPVVARVPCIAAFEGYVNLWRAFRALLDAEESLRCAAVARITGFMHLTDKPPVGGLTGAAALNYIGDALALFVAGSGLPGMPPAAAFAQAYVGRVVLEEWADGVSSPHAVPWTSELHFDMLMLQILVKEVVLDVGGGVAAAAAAMDATNCTVPDRLEALLVAWKKVKKARGREAGELTLPAVCAQVGCELPACYGMVTAETKQRAAIEAEWSEGLPWVPHARLQLARLQQEICMDHAALRREQARAWLEVQEAEARAAVDAAHVHSFFAVELAHVLLKEHRGRPRVLRAEVAEWAGMVERERLSMRVRMVMNDAMAKRIVERRAAVAAAAAAQDRAAAAAPPRPSKDMATDAAERLRQRKKAAQVEAARITERRAEAAAVAAAAVRRRAARAEAEAAAAARRAAEKAARRQEAAAVQERQAAEREAKRLQRQLEADRQAEEDKRQAAAHRAEQEAQAAAARRAEATKRAERRAARRGEAVRQHLAGASREPITMP
eukprot:TRINITY_DN4381_c0_g1_i1.p1 TRINITY_DN4381_c0_g1~~TRINITY_DN4381_c0_g1_i1.p1  ORF type:complete len:822 (+),score=298.50 TRINITY_DN4381_c0_g1_i1:351-2468(+)